MLKNQTTVNTDNQKPKLFKLYYSYVYISNILLCTILLCIFLCILFFPKIFQDYKKLNLSDPSIVFWLFILPFPILNLIFRFDHKKRFQKFEKILQLFINPFLHHLVLAFCKNTSYNLFMIFVMFNIILIIIYYVLNTKFSVILILLIASVVFGMINYKEIAVFAAFLTVINLIFDEKVVKTIFGKDIEVDKNKLYMYKIYANFAYFLVVLVIFISEKLNFTITDFISSALNKALEIQNQPKDIITEYLTITTDRMIILLVMIIIFLIYVIFKNNHGKKDFIKEHTEILEKFFSIFRLENNNEVEKRETKENSSGTKE